VTNRAETNKARISGEEDWSNVCTHFQQNNV
jgi:hypothetical protein